VLADKETGDANNRMQVQIDNDRKLVVIGDIAFDTYQKFNSVEGLAGGLGKSYCGHPKERNKRLTSTFGCTPSKFLKLVNAVFYKTFVSEFPDKYVRNFCMGPCTNRSKGKLISQLITKLHASYSKINQADRDGIWNITPFIYKFNLDPKELKQLFGNQVWKQICNNSFTRNKLITDNIRWYAMSASKSGDIDSLRTKVSKLLTISSSILKYVKTEVLVQQHLSLNYKGKYKTVYNNPNLLNKTLDLYYMLRQEQLEFNPKWSPRRVEEEHDNAVLREIARNYSSEEFSFEGFDKLPKRFTLNEGYTAILLKSSAEIGAEGAAMRHCVGSYAMPASQGKYVVYSLQDASGSRYSTLGISVRHSGFVFNQHYKYVNARVDSDAAKKLAEELIKHINFEMKDISFGKSLFNTANTANTQLFDELV